jgi:hypothetical protein
LFGCATGALLIVYAYKQPYFLLAARHRGTLLSLALPLAGLSLYAFIGICEPKEVFWLKEGLAKHRINWEVERCPGLNPANPAPTP